MQYLHDTRKAQDPIMSGRAWVMGKARAYPFKGAATHAPLLVLEDLNLLISCMTPLLFMVTYPLIKWKGEPTN